jgi:hypothetical protein
MEESSGKQHACCGTIMKPNVFVRFNKASMVPVDGVDQAGIKAVLILDGTEMCTLQL